MQTVLVLVIVVVGVCFWAGLSQAMCSVGCTASAIYVVSSNDILSDIAKRFQVSDYTTLLAPNNISDPNVLKLGQPLQIPFECPCTNGQDLGYNFSYTTVQGDEADTIASTKYGNLTTGSWIDNANPNVASFVDINQILYIPVNCSCGSASVSQQYGLFGTYAAQANDTLASLSHDYNISTELLRQYNPTVSFDPLRPFVSILFIPIKNNSGQYPPLISSVSAAGGRNSGKEIIVGATVGGGGVFLLLVGLGIWFLCVRRLRTRHKFSDQDKHQSQLEVDDSAAKILTSNTDSFEYLSNKPEALPADGCIAFSFEELSAATDNFSLAKEIGRGGFAVVFYGEWQGQRLAVKRMAMKETKEFFNELRILSSVHHANLVGLVGYCTEVYLFLVYEYVDNGTLAHHLRSKTDVLPWTKRVQIALDAARGIEYIHDHTRPTYIHRDLKPSNILLDLNHRAKVGDFGLTRLINPDGDGLTNTLARHGTFGYMAPEYAQFGQVSVKLDTYAFGVVLFQIVSGMEALLGQNKQIISVFDDVLSKPDAQELFKSLVDPALGTNYPVESVWKMVILAARCTRNEPELRPQMREVVIELITLSHNVTHNVESHT